MIDSKYFSLDNYSNHSPKGCFLETDLDYPGDMHDLPNYYPLLGEKIEVRKEVLSDYLLQFIEDNNFFY